MKKINWTVVAIVAVALLFVASFFGGRGYGGWGMMGPGMTLAPGAHLSWRTVPGSAGVGGWGFSPFGWIGMAFMWLIPIGFLVLTVLGIVWLVRAIGGENQSALVNQACPSCGRAVQSDWRNCPHCGTQLAK